MCVCVCGHTSVDVVVCVGVRVDIRKPEKLETN